MAVNQSDDVRGKVVASAKVMAGEAILLEQAAEVASDSEVEVEIAKVSIAMSAEEWSSDVAPNGVSLSDSNQCLQALADEFKAEQNWVVARNPLRPHIEVNLKSRKDQNDELQTAAPAPI